MRCLKNNFNKIYPDSALFLDRDGVINVRIIDGYVKTDTEFKFEEGALEALVKFSSLFKYIFVVTNQQGVGKGLLSAKDVDKVHTYMLDMLKKAGGRIDRIYMCPDLKQDKTIYRKPGIGMGLQAKREFPEITFKHSVMVGDTRSDLEFGCRLGMYTVLIGSDKKALAPPTVVGNRFERLSNLADFLQKMPKHEIA